jgi:hypothetical protein
VPIELGRYQAALLAARPAVHLGPENSGLRELIGVLTYNIDTPMKPEPRCLEALRHDPETDRGKL